MFVPASNQLVAQRINILSLLSRHFVPSLLLYYCYLCRASRGFGVLGGVVVNVATLAASDLSHLCGYRGFSTNNICRLILPRGLFLPVNFEEVVDLFLFWEARGDTMAAGSFACHFCLVVTVIVYISCLIWVDPKAMEIIGS